jgi:hypothetical protein
MVVAKQPPDPLMVRAALEECQRQAQKCIDESMTAPSPVSRADWLALAEQWVRTAEQVASQIEKDQQSSMMPSIRLVRR